jgi:hypothetical protein
MCDYPLKPTMRPARRPVKHIGANYQGCGDRQRATLYRAPVASGACGHMVQAISAQVLDRRARKSYVSLTEVNDTCAGFLRASCPGHTVVCEAHESSKGSREVRSSKRMAAVMKEITAAHAVDLGHVGAYLHLENPPWMSLSIEVIADHLVSVAHYGEMNGDVMTDPEMVFYTNTLDGAWIPVSFRNDYVGSYRVATVISRGEVASFYPHEQADQASFADTWAGNIHEQGFK